MNDVGLKCTFFKTYEHEVILYIRYGLYIIIQGKVGLYCIYVTGQFSYALNAVYLYLIQYVACVEM